jgi:hypothetical protein
MLLAAVGYLLPAGKEKWERVAMRCFERDKAQVNPNHTPLHTHQVKPLCDHIYTTIF